MISENCLFFYIIFPTKFIIDGKKLNQLENLHALLRRHYSDLGSLGHSALPLFAVRMLELPLINYSLNFGDEFAHKILALLQEDQVKKPIPYAKRT